MDREASADIMDGLLRSGAGDEAALCGLVEFAMLHSHVPPREMLVGAEMFARLAGAKGGMNGRSKLAAVLLCRAYDLYGDDFQRADELWWEAIHVMYDLAIEGDEAAGACLLGSLTERADRGEEHSANMLNQIVETLPASMLAAVRQLTEKIKAEA